MSKLKLTIATSDYDHLRDLATGRVTAEGSHINYPNFPIAEIFHRSALNRECDFAELSLGQVHALVLLDEVGCVGI